jgi:hypothetical protein
LNLMWRMVRRASDAGIEIAIDCHTFLATGITDYLTNGGRIELGKFPVQRELKFNGGNLCECLRTIVCSASKTSFDFASECYCHFTQL